MPLTPPPDYSKAVLAVAIGLAAALLVHQLTRSTIPHSGDNIHSLPFGGSYVDGTKRIRYEGPSRSNTGHFWLPALIVAVLPGVIWLGRPRTAHICRCPLCAPARAP